MRITKKLKDRVKKEEDKVNNWVHNRDFVMALDVDGTITEQEKIWPGFLHVGRPNKQFINFLQQIKKKIHIVVHTCRVTTADNILFAPSIAILKKWLQEHKVPYNSIWTSAGKPGANVYIDDKACNPNCKECMIRLKGELNV